MVLTTAAAGISGTLGSVSVKDARELLSALLTAPDHSSSLAGMSTCANRAPGGLREVHFSLLLYVHRSYANFAVIFSDHLDATRTKYTS